MDLQGYTDRYAALLRRFVRTGEEVCLAQAADLGREMVIGDLPLEDLGEIQEQAVRRLAAEFPDATLLVTSARLTAPMLEMLMAYGLAFRELLAQREQLTSEVVHLERMRVSGELAAGVSHNLNNMLTSVLGPAQLLLRHGKDPVVRREVEAILTAGRRAQELVQRLNQAVRYQRDEPLGAVSLSARVQEVIEMARSRWKDEPEARGVTIGMVTDLANVPAVQGIASELDDAILNLILNAVDAMPEGGTLSITTQPAGAGVRLTVSDTGTGMEAQTCRRVFEPFYTTKTEVGSGLGLSTVHGTLIRCGGTIDVDSTPGEGTTFTVWLPLWTESCDPPETVPSGTGPARPGKLLIVEDDEDVAGLLQRLLSERHAVETARDGVEALDRITPGRYDIALIDLSMPGLAGDQVAAQIRRVDPLMATVLITGWSLERDDTRLSWFDFQIRKPFDDLEGVEAVVTEAIRLHDARREQGGG